MMDYLISPDLSLKENVCQFFDTYQCIHTKEHSLKVANESLNLAHRFGVDSQKCYQAALLHDISAVISHNQMMEIALQNAWTIDPSEEKYPFLLHQRVSALFAQNIFQIEDKDVLSAITCHTTLKAHPSQIDLVVFLADKIQWDQPGLPPYLEVIEEGMKISLAYSAYLFLKEQLQHKRILYPHQWLKEAYEDLSKRGKKDMKKYKAVIYDIDGTVLNTLNMNMYPLMRIIKEELNEDWSFEDVLKFATYPGMKVMEELNIKDKEKTYARWVQYVNEYEEGATLYEGFEEVFVKLEEAGIIQAVVSAKTKAQYQIDMVEKGLDKYMKATILAEDTDKHKPDPTPLLECLKRLQLQPDEVIYIGDARSDELASQNAHIDFGYAKWGNVAKEKLKNATIVLEKPLDLLQLI